MSRPNSRADRTGVPDPFDEYRSNIKKLKTLLVRLEKDKESLQDRLIDRLNLLRSNGLKIDENDYYAHKATMIQARWRG
jgi:hypothetical protein